MSVVITYLYVLEICKCEGNVPHGHRQCLYTHSIEIEKACTLESIMLKKLKTIVLSAKCEG